MRLTAIVLALTALLAAPLRGQRFEVVHGIMAAAIAADVTTTLLVCPACRERNPLARPFVSRGPIPTVALGAASAITLTLVDRALKRSEHFHRVWWLPAAVTIVGCGYAAVHNYRITRRRGAP